MPESFWEEGLDLKEPPQIKQMCHVFENTVHVLDVCLENHSYDSEK